MANTFHSLIISFKSTFLFQDTLIYVKKQNAHCGWAFLPYAEMEHLAGIEPVSLAWEAKVLPLNYRCSRKDSPIIARIL